MWVWGCCDANLYILRLMLISIWLLVVDVDIIFM